MRSLLCTRSPMNPDETDRISLPEASKKGRTAETHSVAASICIEPSTASVAACIELSPAETHSVADSIEPSRADSEAKPAPRELGADEPSSSVCTTEIYKVRIGNLPSYFGFRQLRALLTKRLNLTVAKLKAQPGANWAYATFHSDEETQTALKAIDGFEWKKRILTAKGAKAIDQPVMKTLAENLKSSPPAKKLKLEESPVESMCACVCVRVCLCDYVCVCGLCVYV